MNHSRSKSVYTDDILLPNKIVVENSKCGQNETILN